KKDIFVYFTGSDWCSYCRVLHKKVFDKDNFLVNLQKEYVLLKIDFPQSKPLPEAEQERNEQLSEDYSIEGFPTVLLMDKDGRTFAKTGFRDEGPAEYTKHLKSIAKNKAERDKNFAAAKSLNGVEKAEALIKALNSLGDVPTLQYKYIQKQIVESDPEDKTGYQKEVLIKEKVSGLEQKVVQLVEGEKSKDALKAIDEFLTKHSPQGEVKQKVMLMKIYTYERNSTNLDEVDMLMDSIIAINEKSETAENARSIKAQIVEMKKEKPGK
ncbi:MAG: thioredoxin family protein, partial [Lentisphaeraceae bacterium]|nr:thioredoxin family protein [Lentisphaeraceae bacterium]